MCKRDLLQTQKRPNREAKETEYGGKRDLTCQNFGRGPTQMCSNVRGAQQQAQPSFESARRVSKDINRVTKGINIRSVCSSDKGFGLNPFGLNPLLGRVCSSDKGGLGLGLKSDSNRPDDRGLNPFIAVLQVVLSLYFYMSRGIKKASWACRFPITA